MLIFEGKNKIAFQGNHCIAGLVIVQEFGKIAKAELIAEWEVINSNAATDQEKIAHFISSLPTLSEEKCHPDQVCEWVRRKDWAVKLAKCYQAGKGQPDNPLLRELEDGLIDQWKHDYIWLECDLYENLWKLIKLRGRQIKSAIKRAFGDFPFACGRELMEEIIRADIDDEFRQCLKKKYEWKPTHLKEIAKLKRKMHRDEISDPELERLYALIDQHAPYPIWYDRLLSVCEVLAERDPFISTRLNINSDIIDGLCRLKLKAECDPLLKHHRRPAETWIDGKKNPRRKANVGA